MGVITAHSGCDGTEDNSLEFMAYALASEAVCPIACINMEYHLYTGAADITARNLKRALEIRAELMGRSGIL